MLDSVVNPLYHTFMYTEIANCFTWNIKQT